MKLPEVGTRYQTEFVIPEKKVHDFAAFSGDDNPVHVSYQGANEYGFQNPVSHGAILLSEISRIIGTELPGYGAFWSDLSINYVSPVFWNEKVNIEVEVLQSSVAVSVVKLGINVTKGTKKVLTGTAKVMCLNKFNRRLAMPEASKRFALVTGGSRGLGLAVAEELLESGYNTVTVSRNGSPEISYLKDKYPDTFHSIFLDLNDFTSLRDKILEINNTIGGINVIVHAAGPVPSKKGFGKTLNNDLDNYFNIYLKSLIEILDVCTPNMKAGKYGRIITIGTSFIFGTPPQSMHPYIIGKEALWGLTKCLAADLGRFGVTANMVSPSMMLTDMTSDIPNSMKHLEAESNPIKRLVEPDEVAKTVAFLCGDGGTFINGTNVPMTGGSV